MGKGMLRYKFFWLGCNDSNAGGRVSHFRKIH